MPAGGRSWLGGQETRFRSAKYCSAGSVGWRQEEDSMETPGTAYSRLCEGELILRDHLAAQRTVLANERTALAYLRTVLTFLIGGASFIQFFDLLAIKLLGWVFIPMALLVGVFGLVKYVQVKRLLGQIGSAPREGSAPIKGGD